MAAKDSVTVNTNASTKKNDTGVFPHPCDNPGQDRLYGKGNRLFNYGTGKGAWRCTVCKGMR